MAEKKSKHWRFWRLSQVTDMKMLKMLNRKFQMKMILKMCLKSRFAAEDEDDLMEKWNVPENMNI